MLELQQLLRGLGHDARLVVTGPPGPHNPANTAYLAELLALRGGSGAGDAAVFLYESFTDATGRPREVSDAMLGDLYRLADGLLFPSRYEGFGSPIAEAMRFGVPIVASGIQVLAETAGGAASYRHPDVPREWADEVRRLAADGEARDARVRAAHARSATLTYDATARRMLELARAAAAR